MLRVIRVTRVIRGQRREGGREGTDRMDLLELVGNMAIRAGVHELHPRHLPAPKQSHI